MTVYTKEQARDWFIHNAGGSVDCSSAIYGTRTCHSYPEARDFFNGEGEVTTRDRQEDDDNSSLLGMAIGAGISSLMSSDMDTPSMPDPTPDTTPDSSFDSGGGDFGGGGGGSDW